jgi:drug/metabolite transporter superfamily protein YnfA
MSNDDRKWAGIFSVVVFTALGLANILNCFLVCYHLWTNTSGWIDFYKTLSLAQAVYIAHGLFAKEMSHGDHWLI